MTILPFIISLCLLNSMNRYKYALNVTRHLACTEQTNLLDSSPSFFNSLSLLQIWLHLRRTQQSNFSVAMAAKSYLVIPTANSVTTVVTLASSPFLAPSHFPVSFTLSISLSILNFTKKKTKSVLWKEKLRPHVWCVLTELASKMAEMCGGVGGSITVTIRCQLPTEDLDALVSITSDEDLANLIEEYDLVSSSSPMKIRVFLNPPKSAAGSKKSPPPLALPSSTTTSSSSTTSSTSSSPRSPSLSKPPLPPSPPRITTVTKNPCYGCYVHRNSRNIYLVHNGNHWQ